MDGAAATSLVHRMLGTQPPAKRVRFNHQSAIRPIPSCKEATPPSLDRNLTTPPTQVTAATTDGTSAFGNPPESLPREANFHCTLKTDPKPPNRARRFLRKFFQMVTDMGLIG